jgi:hypothetical protein
MSKEDIMPTMVTSLTGFSNNGDSKTSTLSAHTVSQPQLVIEKRKVPVGSQTVAESSVSVVIATTDGTNILPQKYVYNVVCRSPIAGQSAEKAIALATLRDVVASDEFANMLDTQEFLSP